MQALRRRKFLYVCFKALRHRKNFHVMTPLILQYRKTMNSRWKLEAQGLENNRTQYFRLVVPNRDAGLYKSFSGQQNTVA